MTFKIFFDGGTRLMSTCVFDETLSFYDVKHYNMKLTNNQLEYMALKHAIDYADKLYSFLDNVVFLGDSELIIKHMKGEYQVKDIVLKGLYQGVSEDLLKITGKPHSPDMFQWIARSFNEAGVHLEELG